MMYSHELLEEVEVKAAEEEDKENYVNLEE